jgi:hypothetical protein
MGMRRSIPMGGQMSILREQGEQAGVAIYFCKGTGVRVSGSGIRVKKNALTYET